MQENQEKTSWHLSKNPPPNLKSKIETKSGSQDKKGVYSNWPGTLILSSYEKYCRFLGGVTRTTNEAVLLCEAAGFNIIIG